VLKATKTNANKNVKDVFSLHFKNNKTYVARDNDIYKRRKIVGLKLTEACFSQNTKHEHRFAPSI